MQRVSCLLASLLVLLAACAEAADSSGLTIIYSGNLAGHLEPCGCAAESDFGGLDRHAVMLDRLRAEKPEAIAIAHGGLLAHGGVTERVKAEFILQGFDLLHYDAVGLQWPDLVFGRAFLGQVSLPWVASNWRGAEFPVMRLIRRGARKAAFFAWLDPEREPRTGGGNPIYPVDNTLETLAQRLAGAKNEGAMVILATAVHPDHVARLPLSHVDLLLAGTDGPPGEPLRVGKTLVVRPEKWGMRLGVLDLNLDDQGHIADWRHRVVDLGADLGHAPRMFPWYAAYTERVKLANQERIAQLRAKRQGDTGPFVGAQPCRSCHAAPFEAWQKSPHARALPTLEKVNKDFDPDCLVCHTVGFALPGGFVEKGVTPHLAGVQCESCHGAGREHAREGGARIKHLAADQSEPLCRGCHNALHAPAFEFKHARRQGIPCGQKKDEKLP
ncbi:MAG: hypothetical protein HQL63_03780 [Magnetococcales bacterium]|nr:hypothetical protein [Magnetococcales bacterium]MBF0321878.1 hypothetical protein [Magnetococcales bacterium]